MHQSGLQISRTSIQMWQRVQQCIEKAAERMRLQLWPTGECLFSSEEQCHLSVRQRMLKPLTFRATQLRNARVLFIFRGNRCLVFERN